MFSDVFHQQYCFALECLPHPVNLHKTEIGFVGEIYEVSYSTLLQLTYAKGATKWIVLKFKMDYINHTSKHDFPIRNEAGEKQ